MNKLFVLLSLFFCLGAGAVESAPSDIYAGSQNMSTRDHHPGHYGFYDWGRGQNGWGYCYQFDHYGYVMNNGRPVHPMNCERVHPSYFAWGNGMNGYTYCYQWTPYGIVTNEGRPVHPRYCY